MCVSVQTIGQCVTVHTGQCVCLCRQPVNVSTVLVLRMTSVSVTAQTTGRCQHEAGFMGDQSVCVCRQRVSVSAGLVSRVTNARRHALA